MAKRDRELEQIKIELCEDICLKVLQEAGIVTGKYEIVISPLKKYCGLCVSPTEKGKPFLIKINSKLVKDGANEDALLGTIGHELLHTCPERVSMTHNRQFMKRAEILRKNGIYANTSFNDYFLDHPEEEYIEVYCDCGEKHIYAKSDFNKNDETICPICGKTIVNDYGKFHYEDGKKLLFSDYKKSSHTPL